jgi:hypothetical protein
MCSGRFRDEMLDVRFWFDWAQVHEQDMPAALEAFEVAANAVRAGECVGFSATREG